MPHDQYVQSTRYEHRARYLLSLLGVVPLSLSILSLIRIVNLNNVDFEDRVERSWPTEKDELHLSIASFVLVVISLLLVFWHHHLIWWIQSLRPPPPEELQIEARKDFGAKKFDDLERREQRVVIHEYYTQHTHHFREFRDKHTFKRHNKSQPNSLRGIWPLWKRATHIIFDTHLHDIVLVLLLISSLLHAFLMIYPTTWSVTLGVLITIFHYVFIWVMLRWNDFEWNPDPDSRHAEHLMGFRNPVGWWDLHFRPGPGYFHFSRLIHMQQFWVRPIAWLFLVTLIWTLVLAHRTTGTQPSLFVERQLETLNRAGQAPPSSLDPIFDGTSLLTERFRNFATLQCEDPLLASPMCANISAVWAPRQVVLVVVSGLRLDTAQNHPDWIALRNSTDWLFKDMRVELPTQDSSNWASYLTGSVPEIIGQMGDAYIRETHFDTLFSRGAALEPRELHLLHDLVPLSLDTEINLNGSTFGTPFPLFNETFFTFDRFVSATREFGRLVETQTPMVLFDGDHETHYHSPYSLPPNTTFGDAANTRIIAGDIRRTDALRNHLQRPDAHTPWLSALQLEAVDKAGHQDDAKQDLETLTNRYMTSAAVAARLVKRVQETLSATTNETAMANNTLLIVVSDHGHVNHGGHGGNQHEVDHIPLLMWRPGGFAIPNGTTDGLNPLVPPANPLEPWYGLKTAAKMINSATGQPDKILQPMDVTAAIAQFLQLGTPRQSVGRWIPELLPFVPVPALPAVFHDAFVHRRAWTHHYLAQAGVPRDQMKYLFDTYPELLDEAMTPLVMDLGDTMGLFAGLDMFYRDADHDFNVLGLIRNIGVGLSSFIFWGVFIGYRYGAFSLTDWHVICNRKLKRKSSTHTSKSKGKRKTLGWRHEQEEVPLVKTRKEERKLYEDIRDVQLSTFWAALTTVFLFWLVALGCYTLIFALKGHNFWDITHLDEDGTRFTRDYWLATLLPGAITLFLFYRLFILLWPRPPALHRWPVHYQLTESKEPAPHTGERKASRMASEPLPGPGEVELEPTVAHAMDVEFEEEKTSGKLPREDYIHPHKHHHHHYDGNEMTDPSTCLMSFWERLMTFVFVDYYIARGQVEFWQYILLYRSWLLFWSFISLLIILCVGTPILFYTPTMRDALWTHQFRILTVLWMALLLVGYSLLVWWFTPSYLFSRGARMQILKDIYEQRFTERQS